MNFDASLMYSACVPCKNPCVVSVFHGGRGVLAANDGRKKPRSVMATDSDWRAIRSRAGRAEMTASEFLVGRGLAPAEPVAARAGELPSAVTRRVAVDLRILVLAERLRFEAEGKDRVWQRVVEEAEASVAADERES